MKPKVLLIIYSAMTLAFGLGMLFAPEQMTGGVKLSDHASWIVRSFGSTLVGVSIIGWFARNTREPSILQGFGIALLFTVGVLIYTTVTGKTPPASWGSVVVNICLAGAFLYLSTKME